MFSRLKPFFKTTFRKTEYADTRLGIREHEQNKRNNQDSDQSDDNHSDALWTDETVVSIEALRAFLISFLRNEVESEHTQNTSAQSQTLDANAQNRAINLTTGQAAQAYQQTAMRNASMSAYTPEPVIESQNSVKVEEIRIMNQLITDLNTLASNRVEHLVIPKEDSFLKSLQSAINNAKSN